ncbi:MAG TPA: DUF1844 domain-containing protein [Thermodesulfobacteriota bacterium]|nr:DUF1844 domain-containing protein [Thermodesulfobacteriota bacterium]
MESGEDKKGFTIRDRRASAKAEPAQEAPKESAAPQAGEKPAEERKEQATPGAGEPELPEINFSSFILSLSTSALLNLGEVPDPQTSKTEKSLPLAKQSIDILGLLKEKTRGNLTSDEEKLLEHLLADLRWRYVRAARG